MAGDFGLLRTSGGWPTSAPHGLGWGLIPLTRGRSPQPLPLPSDWKMPEVAGRLLGVREHLQLVPLPPGGVCAPPPPPPRESLNNGPKFTAFGAKCHLRRTPWSGPVSGKQNDTRLCFQAFVKPAGGRGWGLGVAAFCPAGCPLAAPGQSFSLSGRTHIGAVSPGASPAWLAAHLYHQIWKERLCPAL